MTGRERDRIAARDAVAAAAHTVAPAWPLSSFVAVNPFAGLEHLRFDEALRSAAMLYRAPVLPASDADDAALDAALAEYAHLAGDPGVRLGPREVDATAIRRAILDGRIPSPAVTTSAPAAATLGDWAQALGWGDVPAAVGERVGRWLAAYLAPAAAAWAMPYRDAGFYAAWLRLARYERRGGREAAPERADDLLAATLHALEIPPPQWAAYLARHLAQQPGWAGVVKRLEDDRTAGIDLTTFLALRVRYERLELEGRARSRDIAPRFAALRDAVASTVRPYDPALDDERVLRALTNTFGGRGERAIERDAAAAAIAIVRAFDEHAQAQVRLIARERAFERRLLDELTPRSARHELPPAAAQFVFCIDARSEPLRRALEAIGGGRYRTEGFAGFYGVPFRFRAYGAADDSVQAPVLVKPVRTIVERPDARHAALLRRADARRRARQSAIGGAVGHGLAAFGAVEMLGPFALLAAAWRTFAGRFARRGSPVAPLAVDDDGGAGLPLAEQVLYAETALRMMGLTRGFAPLVVLCGHGGATVNNAFAAALDCGACGGNNGLVNARVAAAILNREAVRRALRPRGIAIPDATRFVAAEHDTTRDRLRIVTDDVADVDRALLGRVATDLERAGDAARAQRRRTLPASPLGADDPLARADDWAQVRPEWGLARNAAFVCGPRSFTQHVDLQGRCFLHSYDAAADDDGGALEQILTAPLVVATWINLQYFFAGVDPERWGSGDKMLQQPVGEIGVLLGNGGDLRPGLPLQAVAVGDRPYHESLRLLAVVVAPVARIDAIVARQRVLRRLFDNRWVRLIAVDPDDGRFRRYAGAGTWEPVTVDEVTCAVPA